MRVNSRRLIVEWGDCDPARIVFYPRYFAWFNEATAALFASAGFTRETLLQSFGVVALPMVDTRAKFLQPSTFGDEIVIETRIAEFRSRSFDVHHRLLNAGSLAVEGFETRVCGSRGADGSGRIRATPIPQAVLDRLGTD